MKYPFFKASKQIKINLLPYPESRNSSETYVDSTEKLNHSFAKKQTNVQIVCFFAQFDRLFHLPTFFWQLYSISFVWASQLIKSVLCHVNFLFYRRNQKHVFEVTRKSPFLKVDIFKGYMVPPFQSK